MSHRFLKFQYIFTLATCVNILIQGSQSTRNLPEFGRAMREEFLLRSDYINLNHGSYGTYPKAVQAALHQFQDRAEAHSDLWIRREAEIELANVRRQLAQIVNCDAEDLVVVPNTTTGINAVFRSLLFQLGDKILHFSTIYGAMRSLIQYITDYSNGNVTSIEFDVMYPITNDELLTRFEEFIQANLPIRIALIDHITSVPAIVNPIERLIPILRRYNISVLIDGAHALGQVPINITALAPDYYITNAYKWMYSARGSAMLYVNKALQGDIHPTSISSNYARPSRFQLEFFWTGCIDYSPYMTIPAALEFRAAAGGEQAIMNYTHVLALEGGRLMSEKFGGTRIIQAEESQVGAMIDVELPLINPDAPILTTDFWIDTTLATNVYAPAYKHNGVWWLRLSAQIYNDLSDFETVANVFLTICDGVNNNATVSSL